MLESNTYFAPRVINPKKIMHALIFSATEELQKAAKTLKREMPWVHTQTILSPVSVQQFHSDQAAILICDDTALNLIDIKALKQKNPDLMVALLTSMKSISCSPPAISAEKFPYTAKADLIFSVNQKENTSQKIVTSVVRNAEDHLNIDRYSLARRYIFLVVDDEPRWTSQFLPVLYDIIGQRAAVKVTRTYKESLQFLFGVSQEDRISRSDYRSSGHGDDVVCLITDMFYPRDDKTRSDAGSDLIHLIDRYYPRFPKIIASKARQADDLKGTAFLLPKGDPGSLETLRHFIHDFTGMGDFLILNKSGRELYRLKNIHGMLEVLKKAEKDTKTGKNLREILEQYGERDNFSTWLYMHGYKDLADKLLPMRVKGRRLVSLLRRQFEAEIASVDATPLLIDDTEIFSLPELLEALRNTTPAKLQEYSASDVFSTWLDRKGYAELAEELRPIHGSGPRLEKRLMEKIESWIRRNHERSGIHPDRIHRRGQDS
jgi:hypothetical protein